MVAIAKATNRAVSEMLKINDGFTAFCIDEAALYVVSQLQAGKVPIKRTNNRETAEFLKKGRW